MASRWRYQVGTAVIFLLVACGSPTPAPTNPPAPIPSSTPSPNPSPTASPSPSATLEPVPECLSEAGHIAESELVDPALPRSLPYRVYVPPCATELRGSLPTLFLLHGVSFTDSQWDELGIDELTEAWIATGRAQPFLIVMPWERRGLDFETAITEQLIPHIEEVYGASPERAQRAIGGISRGGGWALRIGLEHPELFGAIGLHSPAVLLPNLFDLPGWIEAIPAQDMPAIWIDMGDRDTLRLALLDLTELFDQFGVPYTRRSYPGEHNTPYWSAHVPDYLNWYVGNWQASGPAP